MTKPLANLAHLMRLSYLSPHDTTEAQLNKDIGAIIDFVESLKKVDTTHITPLFHPFDLHQRLRCDEVTEQDCVAELEAIAPLFEDGSYLVPKVIAGDN